MGNPTSPNTKPHLSSSGKYSPPAPSYSDPSYATPGPSDALLLDFEPPAPPPDDELPPYNDLSDPSYLGIEPPPFSRYTPLTHRIANGKVVSHDEHLNTDPEALFQWLHSESELPPSPRLHLEGTHRTSTTTHKDGRTTTTTSTITDFSLTFDLTNFLAPGCTVDCAHPLERRRRGTRIQVLPSPQEAEFSVRDWCVCYVRNPALWKEFVLRKWVEGLDEAKMLAHVEAMVRSTNYRGDVKITFPVANRQVVLAPNSLVCQMRYGPARWFFYVTFLWLLTWPVLWVWTRRWDVVDARFQTVEGVEGRWVDRWGWVVTRMVRQRRSKRDPLTDDNLRWIECHEIMSDEERDRRSNVGGIQGWFGGFLSRIGDVRENSGEWGVHDW